MLVAAAGCELCLRVSCDAHALVGLNGIVLCLLLNSNEAGPKLSVAFTASDKIGLRSNTSET